MKHILAPKVVSDPIRKIIDIRPVLPIIETREFQSLGYKYQLGVTYLVFPSATHTRKTHSLGAYAATKELTQWWQGSMGLISKEEAEALCVYALIHDIGHYPFSHVSEPLFKISHKERGIRITKKLQSNIESTGVNFKLVLDFMMHKNPLHLAVSDKNLGTEKFDYLQRDGLLTLGQTPEIQYLQRHIYWINKQLVIDEKVVDNAKEVQDFYLKMNKKVYLNKDSSISQRAVQKMSHLLIKYEEIKLDELAELNDFELLSRLGQSKNKDVRELFNIFIDRNLFKEVVIIRDRDFIDQSLNPNKPVSVFGLKNSTLRHLTDSPKLSAYNQESLLAIESEVAKKLRLKATDILVVPFLSADRFEAKDINILSSDGKIHSMRKRYPNHFKAMKEDSKAHMAIRVCSTQKYRKTLHRHSKWITKFLINTCA